MHGGHVVMVEFVGHGKVDNLECVHGELLINVKFRVEWELQHVL